MNDPTPDPTDAPEPAAAEPARERGPIRPRLWPALVIILIQLAIIYLPRLTDNAILQFMGTLYGPMIGGLLLVVWWLMFSRVPLQDRISGVLMAATVGFVAYFAAHGTMKLGLLAYVLPTATTLTIAVLLLAAFVRCPWTLQAKLGVLTLVVTIAVFSCVRVDGMDGNLKADMSWRWSPTAEDKFMKELDSLKEFHSGVHMGAAALAITEGDWPEFRGPERNGIVRGVRINTDWTANPPKELWRHRVGPGWGAFCVVDNRIFTQEQRGADECVVCYNADTGLEVWVHGNLTRFFETVGGAGPRATPTFHETRLFSLGANGDLTCLNADGSLVWSANLVEDTEAKVPMWGFSSSPLIHGQNVIVFAGGAGNTSVVAYHRFSGRRAWAAGTSKDSYSSPQLCRLLDTDQILMLSGDGLASFNPETGDVLWEHPWSLGEDAARIVQPLVVGDSKVMLGTGFGFGSQMIEVSVTDEKWTTKELWTSTQMKPYFNDGVLHKGHYYGFDGAILAAIDVETGERAWKGGRYGHGQLLLLEDQDLLVVVSEKGLVALVEAKPDGFAEVASFQALDGKTWNHPVVAGGRLYVRNGEEAACYELTPE